MRVCARAYECEWECACTCVLSTTLTPRFRLSYTLWYGPMLLLLIVNTGLIIAITITCFRVRKPYVVQVHTC